MKKKFIIVLTVIALLFGAGVFTNKLYMDNKIEKLKTQMFPITKELSSYDVKPIEASWIFDPSDEAKMVYFYDCVFIARVDEIVGTTYRNVEKLNSGKINADPYTNYKITNLYNIKGDTVTGMSIPFAVFGGVDYKQKYVSFIADTSFIEVGKTYLIVARIEENGELSAFGPNTVIPLSDGKEADVSVLNASDIAKKYKSVIDKYEKAIEKNDDEFAPQVRYESKYSAVAVK